MLLYNNKSLETTDPEGEGSVTYAPAAEGVGGNYPRPRMLGSGRKYRYFLSYKRSALSFGSRVGPQLSLRTVVSFGLPSLLVFPCSVKATHFTPTLHWCQKCLT
jgi:hypothetical protein